MAWKEQVEGWGLDIVDGDSLTTYIGSGERLFVESAGTFGCTTALPSIGDAMYDPHAESTYTKILCTNINFKRTHSSGNNGLTATVSYASPELQSSESQRQEDKEAGSFSADLVNLNVQGGTTWFWYTKNAQDGATTAFPFLLPDADNGGPCAENLPISVMQFQRTKRIRFSSDTALEAWIPKIKTYGGKLNNATFLGFEKGQVLLGGVTGSVNGGVWDVDIVFIVRIIGGDITKDDWNYMPSDASGTSLFNRPIKADATISPGAGYVGAEAISYIYEYADISQILDTSAPTPPAP